MLTRLYATNYRCLVNFEFKPNAKQLIIGRNGTGKSTVFEVLAVLRDIVVRGSSCAEYLGGRTRTRWQRVAEQRFELDLKGNGGEYRYVLVAEEPTATTSATSSAGVISGPPDGGRYGPRVKQEMLSFDGVPLFRFAEGIVGIFDEQRHSLRSDFRFDSQRSGLTIAAAQVPDQTKLAWFNRWFEGIVQVQLDPWAMVARSDRESSDLARDLGNFADWYRHVRLESGDAVFEAMNDLRDAMQGFEALDAKEAGLDVRVLQATFSGPSGRKIDLPFHELSEGQRALIALYVLLHCAVGEDRLLLIDEPDNFIALAEIQPWLLKLLDRVDETNGQVMLVSHHPELLDQLAAQGGVLFERTGVGETRVRPFLPPDDSGLKASEIIARGWEVENTSTYGLGLDTITKESKRRSVLRKRKRA